MATHTQKNDLTGTWNISTGGDTWILAKNASITTDHLSAIDITGAEFEGNTIVLNGDITVNNADGIEGLRIDSKNTKLVIGESSVLDVVGTSSDAIYAYRGLDVENSGLIKGGSNGLLIHQGLTLDNTGVIKADTAVLTVDNVFVENSGKLLGVIEGLHFGGDGSEVINAKSGVIRGGEDGIQVTGEGSSLIRNFGLIKGENAINDAGLATTVINKGTLVGDVLLKEGDDIFDTRIGTVQGTIFGGEGQDTYKVSSQSVDISEAADEGLDEVKSTVSYTLGDNLETLDLLGKKDINATGNDDNNTLAGNRGDNILKGRGGEDFFSSDRGNDLMIGGADADVFEFNGKNGHDTIKDYVDGTDKIFVTFLDSEDGINDLITNHATETDGGVMIEHGAHSMFIKGMDLNDLSADDFILPF